MRTSKSNTIGAAKYRLSEALVISETAGLENDEMTARTYVHMAAVYLTGLRDREEAIQQFMLALRINPNITITPGLESPALKSAYLQARQQMGLPPDPDTTAPILPQVPPVPAFNEGTAPLENNRKPPANDADETTWSQEPDLPARIPAPLYCHLPFDTPPGQDVVVRCLTQQRHRKSSATFHYRPQGSDGEYVGMPMERSPKGWLTIVVPGRAIQGKSLSYYVKAEVPGSSKALYLGHPEAPNELIIRNPTNPDGIEDASDDPETVAAATNSPPSLWRRNPAPIAPARARIDLVRTGQRNRRGLSRTRTRRQQREGSHRHARRVQSGFSPMTLFQIEPEIGYQLSRRFSISVLGRYQYAPNATPAESKGENAIPTSAYAGFLRGQFAFSEQGRIADLRVGRRGNWHQLSGHREQTLRNGGSLQPRPQRHASRWPRGTDRRAGRHLPLQPQLRRLSRRQGNRDPAQVHGRYRSQRGRGLRTQISRFGGCEERGFQWPSFLAIVCAVDPLQFIA